MYVRKEKGTDPQRLLTYSCSYCYESNFKSENNLFPDVLALVLATQDDATDSLILNSNPFQTNLYWAVTDIQ